jgi:hypothetical protein
MMGRKGLSPVVATIAVILVTIGAVTFIAGFLVPYMQGQLVEGTECTDYREYFTFDDSFGFNCYVLDDGDYLTAVTVRADSVPNDVAQGIKGFQFLFYYEGDSNKIVVEDGFAPNPNNEGLKMLNNNTREIEVPSDGGVRTYTYNSSVKVERVEIFPVLKENERLCPKSGDIETTLPCSQEVY